MVHAPLLIDIGMREGDMRMVTQGTCNSKVHSVLLLSQIHSERIGDLYIIFVNFSKSITAKCKQGGYHNMPRCCHVMFKVSPPMLQFPQVGMPLVLSELRCHPEARCLCFGIFCVRCAFEFECLPGQVWRWWSWHAPRLTAAISAICTVAL